MDYFLARFFPACAILFIFASPYLARPAFAMIADASCFENRRPLPNGGFLATFTTPYGLFLPHLHHFRRVDHGICLIHLLLVRLLLGF